MTEQTLRAAILDAIDRAITGEAPSGYVMVPNEAFEALRTALNEPPASQPIRETLRAQFNQWRDDHVARFDDEPIAREAWEAALEAASQPIAAEPVAWCNARELAEVLNDQQYQTLLVYGRRKPDFDVPLYDLRGKR